MNHAFFKDFDWQALENHTMESPIKDLVNKYPVALKQYKPEAPRETGAKAEPLEGWTYVKDGNK